MEFARGPHRAVDQPTRQRVVRSILVNGPSTAAALAERLDLTPAAVRRHLDQLLDEGAVEAREPRDARHAGRGRPAKVFALTEAGRDDFDQQYDDLAVQALRFLAETGGDQAVREFADRRVAFVEERFHDVQRDAPSSPRPRCWPRSSPTRATPRPSATCPKRASAGEQLCQQHCPVSHVAHEFPQLCEAETAAIGRVLGRHVQRLATIAVGDGGQPLHVAAEHPADRRGLGLAQLRNSWATWDTGQCCWHSCSPTLRPFPGRSRTEAA